MLAIKKIAPALVVAGSVVGCAPQGTSQAQIIAQVQAGAKNACKFEPDAEPIIQLIPTFGGVASSIVKAICSAINNEVVAAAPGAALPPVVVNGVTITGVAVK